MTLFALDKKAKESYARQVKTLVPFLRKTLKMCGNQTDEGIQGLLVWCGAHMINFATVFAHEILAQKRKDYLETKGGSKK